MTNRCSTSPEFICQQVSREICDENSAQKDDFSTSCKPSKSCRMEIQSVPREVLMPKCIKSMKSICQNETKANCKAEPHLNDQNCTSNCRNESQEICRNVTNPICQPENSFGPCKPDSGKKSLLAKIVKMYPLSFQDKFATKYPKRLVKQSLVFYATRYSQ